MPKTDRNRKNTAIEKTSNRGRPTVKTFPDPIPDTFENVAASVLGTPPKKDHEWEYLKNRK